MTFTPLRLFVGSLIRALLIAAVSPLISHGWVDATTAKRFVDWFAPVAWFLAAASSASISLFWSHYRNLILLDLKRRLDSFLGSPPIPAVPSPLSVQSTVLPGGFTSTETAQSKPTEIK